MKTSPYLLSAVTGSLIDHPIGSMFGASLAYNVGNSISDYFYPN